LTVGEDDALAQLANAGVQDVKRARSSVEIAQDRNSFSAASRVRVLFVALSNDVGSERIISGMTRCGVECAVMSPSTYFCAKIASAKRHFSIPDHRGIWLGTLFVRHRLEDAIHEWQPQLILPLDDISAWLLRSLAVNPMVRPALRNVLIESLGEPEGYSAAVNRQAFMDVAARLGVYKPAHCEDIDVETALAAAKSWGYPVVIKGEHTCGGKGVVFARDAMELVARLPSRAAAMWPRRLKLSAKKSLFHLAGFGAGPVSGTVLQSFVPGVPAFCTLAAWKGLVISSVCFASEQIHPTPSGASTVVRYIENDEMDHTSATMTAALGCSGFVSFDFMLDRKTNRAALIEMNPRSVSSTHLGAVFGRDVCGAFAAKVSGAPLPAAQPVQMTTVVALFPKELERDPNSPYLQSPHVLHDVPEDDPALMEAYLRLLTATHPVHANDFARLKARSLRVGADCSRGMIA
jgi:hypothetical protein